MLNDSYAESLLVTSTVSNAQADVTAEGLEVLSTS